MLSSGEVGEIGASVLIIAMPKSASSSLARTLARAHGLDERNDEINAGNAPQFLDRHRLAQEFHPFPAVPKGELRRIAVDRAALRKLHLFPTPEVLSAIEGVPVIVLLRPPQDVIDAEFRAFIGGIHPRTAAMPLTWSIRRWREAAISGGLLASLEQFQLDWERAAEGRRDLLLISHEQVLADAHGTLARCATHLGLPDVPMTLLRERWSGARRDVAMEGELASFMYVAGVLLTRLMRGSRRRARRLTGAGRRLTDSRSGSPAPTA